MTHTTHIPFTIVHDLNIISTHFLSSLYPSVYIPLSLPTFLLHVPTCVVVMLVGYVCLKAKSCYMLPFYGTILRTKGGAISKDESDNYKTTE